MLIIASLRQSHRNRADRLVCSARPMPTDSDCSIAARLAGGKATLAMQRGTADMVDLLAEPLVTFDQLAGDLQWKLNGKRLQLSGSGVRFSNADAAGELKFTWSSPEVGAVTALNPGVLDLQGSVSRADAARRDLPRQLPKRVPAP